MKRIFRLVGLTMALALLVTACGAPAVPPPAAEAATNAALESVLEVLEEATEEATEAATEIHTEAPTEEVTEIATEEVTEIATEEATEEATLEVTEIATEEATEEATEIATEEVTEVATEEATEEATAESAIAIAASTVTARGLPSEEELAVSVDAANAARGEELFTLAAIPSCTICHMTDGVTTTVGPNLYGLRDRAGERIEGVGPFTYVYSSIRYPHDFTVPDFAAGVMPDYSAVLSEEDIYDLIAYLWTLHD